MLRVGLSRLDQYPDDRELYESASMHTTPVAKHPPQSWQLGLVLNFSSRPAQHVHPQHCNIKYGGIHYI